MNDQDATREGTEPRLDLTGLGSEVREPDVDRDRRHARPMKRLDGGNERVGLEQHFVARAQSCRTHREPEGVGARGDAAGALGAEIGSHLRLKGPLLLAAEKLHATEDPLARRQELGAMRFILAGRIEKGDAASRVLACQRFDRGHHGRRISRWAPCVRNPANGYVVERRLLLSFCASLARLWVMLLIR